MLRGREIVLAAARRLLPLLDRTETLATVALLAKVVRALLLPGRASGLAAVLRALLPLGRAIPLAAARRASLQWGREPGLAELLGRAAQRATIRRALPMTALRVALLLRGQVSVLVVVLVGLLLRGRTLELAAVLRVQLLLGGRASVLAAVLRAILTVERRALQRCGRAWSLVAGRQAAPPLLGRSLALVEARRAQLLWGQTAARAMVPSVGCCGRRASVLAAGLRALLPPGRALWTAAAREAPLRWGRSSVRAVGRREMRLLRRVTHAGRAELPRSILLLGRPIALAAVPAPLLVGLATLRKTIRRALSVVVRRAALPLRGHALVLAEVTLGLPLHGRTLELAAGRRATPLLGGRTSVRAAVLRALRPLCRTWPPAAGRLVLLRRRGAAVRAEERRAPRLLGRASGRAVVLPARTRLVRPASLAAVLQAPILGAAAQWAVRLRGQMSVLAEVR